MKSRKAISILKKIWLDLVILSLLFLFLYLNPGEVFTSDTATARAGMVSIAFLTLMKITMGAIQANIIRKVHFPYIDFETEGMTSNALMVIIIYAAVLLGWALA